MGMYDTFELPNQEAELSTIQGIPLEHSLPRGLGPSSNPKFENSEGHSRMSGCLYSNP
jgi:hypothetical protein